MVDVCNWCSLEFQLPYGLYDAARIEGDVELRIGRDGESYPGIRKDDVHVGGRITLADTHRAVRESDVRLRADDGDDGDHARAAGRLRAARSRRAASDERSRQHVEPDDRIHRLPGKRQADL